jgi:hypothetical protein
MEGISILEAKTEERPYFYEFPKYMIMGDHPTWAILTYDPYPNAGMNDVVRREILGRELVLTAKLKLENRAVDIHPGIALEYQGHEFTVKESVEHLQDDIVEVIGSHFLSLIEPVEAIAKLREILAASNPKL